MLNLIYDVKLKSIISGLVVGGLLSGGELSEIAPW